MYDFHIRCILAFLEETHVPPGWYSCSNKENKRIIGDIRIDADGTCVVCPLYTEKVEDKILLGPYPIPAVEPTFETPDWNTVFKEQFKNNWSSVLHFLEKHANRLQSYTLCRLWYSENATNFARRYYAINNGALRVIDEDDIITHPIQIYLAGIPLQWIVCKLSKTNWGASR